MNSILLVDTDVLSAVLRRHPLAFARANAYALQHSKLTFSAITRFEILRGLKAKSALRQLQEFEIFCAGNVILSLTDDVIDQAAEIFADLYRRGSLIGDADISSPLPLLCMAWVSLRTTSRTSRAFQACTSKIGLYPE